MIIHEYSVPGSMTLSKIPALTRGSQALQAQVCSCAESARWYPREQNDVSTVHSLDVIVHLIEGSSRLIASGSKRAEI
jgi:hypothetical protein